MGQPVTVVILSFQTLCKTYQSNREWKRYNRLQEKHKADLDEAKAAGHEAQSPHVQKIHDEYDKEMVALMRQTRNPKLYAEIIRNGRIPIGVNGMQVKALR